MWHQASVNTISRISPNSTPCQVGLVPQFTPCTIRRCNQRRVQGGPNHPQYRNLYGKKIQTSLERQDPSQKNLNTIVDQWFSNCVPQHTSVIKFLQISILKLFVFFRAQKIALHPWNTKKNFLGKILSVSSANLYEN